MAAFETVDALETEDVYDELDYEHEVNASSSKQQPSYVRLCSVCKENEPDITVLPCRHQCLCKPCYNQWNRVDTEMMNVFPQVQNHDEVNIFNQIETTDRPRPDMKCPLCKKSVTDFIESILS